MMAQIQFLQKKVEEALNSYQGLMKEDPYVRFEDLAKGEEGEGKWGGKRRFFLCRNATMSGDKSRVTFHSKLTAVSSKPVKPGTTHPLSVLDHAMGLHSLHVIFYYKDNMFGSFDLDPMRESLSNVLSLYPNATGRLTRGDEGNWEEKCNDAGVRTIRAKVGTTLDEWLRSADWSEERDLTMWDDMPQDPSIWSPFRVQVNEFEGGGVAIGISCPHMCADATSVTLLFDSWYDIYCQKPISHPPSFDPSALRNLKVPNLETKAAKYYENMSKKTLTRSTKMSSVTFKFSDSTIRKNLSKVQESCPNATPFDLLAALFWTRIAHVKRSGDGQNRSLSICTDFRKLLKPPLPHGYVGNALHFSQVSVTAEQMDFNGLQHIVRLVHGHVLSIEDEEIRSGIDWLEAQKEKGGKFRPPFRMYGMELTCVNMEHMVVSNQVTENETESLMYAAVFGDCGKPVHVSYHVGNAEGEGLIIIMPSAEKGLARNVMVMLPEEEMVHLCEDQAILSLDPTLLLSGRQ